MQKIAALAAVLTLAALPAMAGSTWNGVEANGQALNGVEQNGRILNGWQLQGRQLQGLNLNGRGKNGQAVDASTTRIVGIELGTAAAR